MSPVAAVASLTAFAHWLDGDAVKARVALDRVPPGTAYQMARLINLALELGMDPRTWSASRRRGRTPPRPVRIAQVRGAEPRDPRAAEAPTGPRPCWTTPVRRGELVASRAGDTRRRDGAGAPGMA